MDVALALVVPGVLGGLLIAGLLARLNNRPSSGLVTRATLAPLSPDAINMAHIRVAGVGGLGMMAAAVVIAIYLPELGLSMLAGVGFGAIGALLLIAYRSRAGASHRGNKGLPPGVLSLHAGARVEGSRAAEGRLPDNTAPVTA